MFVETGTQVNCWLDYKYKYGWQFGNTYQSYKNFYYLISNFILGIYSKETGKYQIARQHLQSDLYGRLAFFF